MIPNIHEIFFQEAEEHLQNLEPIIIKIEEDPQNQEMINEAFRAIHSIKGGAGLAGFPGMKDFAHIFEDLFEEIRKGMIIPSTDITTLCLESLDVLKRMLETLKQNGNPSEDVDHSLETEKILGYLEGSKPTKNKPPALKTSSQKHLYFLSLQYDPKIFNTGINPLMFIRDLEMVGSILAIELGQGQLPEVSLFDPEHFHLSWKILIESECSPEEIQDIFIFVMDESSIQIVDMEKELTSVEELERYKIHNKIAHVYIPPNSYNLPDRRNQNKPRIDSAEPNPLTNQSSFIRVQTQKLENIFNTVGELLITQARLSMLSETNEDILPEGFSQITDSLSNVSKVIQEQIASLRMMSLSSTFDGFKRVVRDMANDLGKKVHLELEGQNTELDKNMIERLGDPLKHIIRNSIDHGIETEEERKALGKDPQGLLKLSAFLENGKIIIEVIDDGKGINREKLLAKAIEKGLIKKDHSLSDSEVLNLIFHPGLSTAKEITDISGRGVGMDVVRSSINELHGNVELRSTQGKGTTIRLQLPLTLATLDGMLVKIGGEKYIVPTLSILEIIKPDAEKLKSISSKGELVYFRGSYIPVIRLGQVFEIKSAKTNLLEGELLVVSNGAIKAALMVDRVQEQFQIVLKSLQKNFRKVESISSATILGDGNVALIIDIQAILQRSL